MLIKIYFIVGLCVQSINKFLGKKGLNLLHFVEFSNSLVHNDSNLISQTETERQGDLRILFHATQQVNHMWEKWTGHFQLCAFCH